jgi:17 kDa outer membrane surface antigen
VTGRAFGVSYSPRRRSWHRWARAARLALAVALGVSAESCSYRLGSLFKDKDAEKPAYTATTAERAEGTGEAQTGAALPPEADLAFARAAAFEALTRHGRDVSVPWENPRTGARGTVTPLPSVSTQPGAPCRDFLVSYVLKPVKCGCTARHAGYRKADGRFGT